jgi:hypothetical protein
MSSRLWILTISLLLLPVSCKQQEKAQKKPATDNATPEYTPPRERPEIDVPKEETDDCEKHKKEEDKKDEVTDDEDAELDLRLTGTGNNEHKKKIRSAEATKTTPTSVASMNRGFGLLASDPNYDDDISSILKDKCESCHAGSDENALDTYKKAKALKDKIKSEVASGDMPPKNKSPLTSNEKTAIKNWVTAGAPESSDDVEDEGEEGEGGEDDEKEEDKDSSSDCDEEDKDDKDDEDDKDNDSDNVNATAADWDELLKKKEVEKCKDKGKIFDRLTETCHKAKTAEFSCDKSGIEAAFKKVGINVSSQVSTFVSDGYKIDQCGEFSNEPIVLFYKKETIKEEIKLLIKKLCKKGSAACDN